MRVCIADGRPPASEVAVLPKISFMLRTPAFAQPCQPTRLLTRDLTARLSPRIRSLFTTSFSGKGIGNGSNSRDTGLSTFWTDSARRTPTPSRQARSFLLAAGGRRACTFLAETLSHPAASFSTASTLEPNSSSYDAILRPGEVTGAATGVEPTGSPETRASKRGSGTLSSGTKVSVFVKRATR